MIRRAAKRLGLNYAWGLANYIAGVVTGAGVAGVAAGIAKSFQ